MIFPVICLCGGEVFVGGSVCVHKGLPLCRRRRVGPSGGQGYQAQGFGEAVGPTGPGGSPSCMAWSPCQRFNTHIVAANQTQPYRDQALVEQLGQPVQAHGWVGWVKVLLAKPYLARVARLATMAVCCGGKGPGLGRCGRYPCGTIQVLDCVWNNFLILPTGATGMWTSRSRRLACTR
jgi:hypothetical protein